MKAIIAMIGLMSSAPDVPFSGQSGLLASLQSRLDSTPAGTFLAERVSEWYAPTADELERATTHVRSVWDDCWVAEDEDDELSLERLRAYRATDPVPAVLRGTFTADWVHRKSERLVVDWPFWRISVFDTTDRGADVALHRIHDEHGLTEWSNVSGERTVTTRHSMVEQEEMARGFLHDFLDLRGRAAALLSLATARGSVSERPGALVLEAPLRSLSVLETFGSTMPRKGYFEYPGTARAVYSIADGGPELEIDWFDCSGELVLRNRVRWGASSALPEALFEEVYLPGVGSVIQSVTVSIVRSGAAAALRWAPRPGEEVVDQRLHYPVQYTIGDDGSLPDESWIVAEAEALALSLGAPTEPQVLSANPTGAEREEGHVVLPSIVEVVDPVAILGEQPVGTKKRVRFLVRNVGDELVELGPLEADCGCLEPRIGTTTLGPGETTWITAIQEVQSVGSRTVQLHVPVDGGAREGVTLSVEMEGTSAPLLFPSQLYFGRQRTGAGQLHAALGFLSRDALADGEEPRVSVHGDLSGDLTVRLDDSTETWRVEGTLEPRDSDLFGALEATVVAACPSSGLASTARVLVDRQPDSTSGSWPSGRLSLRMNAGVAQARLRYPDTRLIGWQVLHCSDDVDVQAELRHEDGNGVIELFLIAPDGGARELITCDVELLSSRGRLRIHVIAAAGS